jgi:hypothetical protein
MNRRAFAVEFGAEGESLVRWFLVLRGVVRGAEGGRKGGERVVLTKPWFKEGDSTDMLPLPSK